MHTGKWHKRPMLFPFPASSLPILKHFFPSHHEQRFSAFARCFRLTTLPFSTLNLSVSVFVPCVTIRVHNFLDIAFEYRE